MSLKVHIISIETTRLLFTFSYIVQNKHLMQFKQTVQSHEVN